MPTTFSRSYNNAQDYKDAVRAANKLGFHPEKWWFNGGWETDDGEIVFMSSVNRVAKVGNKYFYVPVDGTITPIKPGYSSTSGRGSIRVDFTDS